MFVLKLLLSLMFAGLHLRGHSKITHALKEREQEMGVLKKAYASGILESKIRNFMRAQFETREEGCPKICKK